MPLTASDVEALLRDELSPEFAGFSVRLETGERPVFEDERGHIRARLMLCTLEPDRSIRDVKMQEIHFIPAEHREDAARTTAFVRQWARGLSVIVAALGAEVDTLMPCDLVLPMPLRDPALRDDGDFARVFQDAATIAGWIRQSEIDGLADELSRWGIADQAQAFLALRRPAIWFGDPCWVDVEEAPTPVGATRFGGEPDLPPEMPWPTFNGEPMTFAAQIDLEALRRFPAARELPPTGLLSFFYAFDDHPSTPSRVIHIASRAGLSRRATPAGGDRRPELTATARALAATMPAGDSPFYAALLPAERVAAFHRSLQAAARGAGGVVDPLAGLEQLLAAWDGYDPDCAEHRVLGYCQPHQGDVYLAAEVHTTGGDWDGASPQGIATSRASRRWRLLLQVWAQIDGALLLEQDCGALYFLIPEDALAAHDWSRVWCELQCS